MRFVAFVVAICLLVQASQSNPITDLIEAAKEVVKNNVITITKTGLNISSLEAKIDGQIAVTTAKRVQANNKLNKLMKKYKDEVKDINRQRKERFGPFTDKDQECIDTKDSQFSRNVDQANTNINNVFVDATAEYTKAQLQIGKLSTKLGLVTVKNNAVVAKCSTLHILKLKKCLTRELDEVEQKIDEITEDLETLREDTKDINEVVDKQVDGVLKDVEGQVIKEVDDYSECLIANLPSSTSSTTTTTTTSTTTTTETPETEATEPTEATTVNEEDDSDEDME